MKQNPRVSIIIAVGQWNAFLDESMPYCKNQDYPDYEIIVLPDEYNGKAIDGVKIIPTGRKSSPGYKRDVGAQNATGEILAFLDDDAYPVREWISSAVKVFLSDSDIAAVGGPAVTPPNDGLSQMASGLIYSSALVGGTYRFRYIVQTRREVDDYPTCNLLVRKDIFDTIGGFETSFYPGEDTKLCLEITKTQKKKIVYDPDVLVYHHRRRMYKPHLRQVWNYGLHRGYFVKRFPETSFRPSYFLPSLWVLGVLTGWLGYFITPWLGYLYLGVIIFYLLVALWTTMTIDVTETEVGEKLAESFTSMAKLHWYVFSGLVATHFVYGLWFIRGLLSKQLPEEKSSRE